MAGRGGGGGGGWGVGGGDKNVIHIVSMPKALVLTAFYAQNTGIYSVFASLYNILHKDVEQEVDV